MIDRSVERCFETSVVKYLDLWELKNFLYVPFFLVHLVAATQFKQFIIKQFIITVWPTIIDKLFNA